MTKSTALTFNAPCAAQGAFFITFEGIEGSGKSSQIELFKKFLIEQDKDILLSREPGGTVFGEKLREAMLSSKEKVDPIAQAMLFASSRAQHLSEKILPFINKPNSIAIIDRYIDSSLAYQGIAADLGIETILEIHRHPPLYHFPHLTFYLKIDWQTSMQRQDMRGSVKDYFESQKKDFYIKLIEGYDKAAELFPQRIKIIDGTQDLETVRQEILKTWKNFVGTYNG
ncbi:MAG: dTMP kinase [Bacteriovoracia bacterium]